INVTPLVDVMLVLLIIFMVAAPMLTTGVTVDLPNANAPNLKSTEDIPLLSVTEDRRVFLFDKEVALEDLATALKNDPKIKKSGEVYVHADENCPYGAVVEVLAVIREVGIEKMGLVTDPPTEAKNKVRSRKSGDAK
ncbi:MAG: ExbD/TolR family protein, partial [Myxococcales bacterium]|nr:ExbD/TolR family protein [Myxococcales bacterium]